MTVVEMVRLISGDEFNNMTDADIEAWDEFVSPFVSKKQFGKLYDRAKALLICHKMKMAGYGDSSLGELGKIGNSFVASSVSDGGSSISFANSGANNTQMNAEYGMTVYGMQYLQLLKAVIVPINISRGVLLDAEL
jgi:hypothetical protein